MAVSAPLGGSPAAINGHRLSDQARIGPSPGPAQPTSPPGSARGQPANASPPARGERPKGPPATHPAPPLSSRRRAGGGDPQPCACLDQMRLGDSGRKSKSEIENNGRGPNTWSGTRCNKNRRNRLSDPYPAGGSDLRRRQSCRQARSFSARRRRIAWLRHEDHHPGAARAPIQAMMEPTGVVPSRTIACSGPASPTCSATARGTLGQGLGRRAVHRARHRPQRSAHRTRIVINRR